MPRLVLRHATVLDGDGARPGTDLAIEGRRITALRAGEALEAGPGDRVVDVVPAPRRPRTMAADVTVHHLLTHTSGIGDYAEEDEDVAEYVRSLEESKDTADLPEASGEAIAREFERYLKRRDHPED